MDAEYPQFVSGLVLIVDDVEDNRVLARAYLERIGWQVDECGGGVAAMEYLRHQTPQAMLIDIGMPDVSGDQLATQVREKLGLTRIRLVGYTAHCFPEEIALYRAAGFDDVLVKPVLLATMAQALPDPRTTLVKASP